MARASYRRFASARAIAVVPGHSVETVTSRAGLPPRSAMPTPLTPAPRGPARASLATGDLELLSAALDDRLHEPYRSQRRRCWPS